MQRFRCKQVTYALWQEQLGPQWHGLQVQGLQLQGFAQLHGLCLQPQLPLDVVFITPPIG